MRAAELEVVDRADLVAVGIDHDLQPGFTSCAGVNVTQVEPVGLRVHLEECPCLERLLDHALEVEWRRRSLADPAGRRVADAIDVRALHRRHDPLGRVVVEAGMCGGDHPVARRELVLGDIEGAVGPDVHLDPLEDAERGDQLVQRVDRFRLALQQVAAKPL
jgi:hypothetical protein